MGFNLITDVRIGLSSVLKCLHSSPCAVDEVTSLQEREKQVERRRKAALFIEELRRKRERQIVQDKELTRLGLNEECEDFVGPKRPKT